MVFYQTKYHASSKFFMKILIICMVTMIFVFAFCNSVEAAELTQSLKLDFQSVYLYQSLGHELRKWKYGGVDEIKPLDGNKVLVIKTGNVGHVVGFHVLRENSEYNYVEFKIKINKISHNNLVKCVFYSPSLSSQAYEKGTESFGIVFSNNGIYASKSGGKADERIGSLNTVWYKVSILVKNKEKRFYLYINEKLAGCYNFMEQTRGRYFVFNTPPNSEIYIDDLYIVGGNELGEIKGGISELKAHLEKKDQWIPEFSPYCQKEYTEPATYKSTPTPSPQTPNIPSTQTTTPQTLTPSENESILFFAERYKVFLDSSIKVIDKVTLGGSNYYVVEYTNIIPYASGIEVLSQNGDRVTDRTIIESVFASIGWRKAATQIKQSDIQTLQNILSTAQKIDKSVTPVVKATGFVLDKINWAKKTCKKIFFKKVCVWDIVVKAYPNAGTLYKGVEVLDRELREWRESSHTISQNLPKVISDLNSIKSGGEYNPELQKNIATTMSAFGKLQAKTDSIASKLSSAISTLSSAEKSIRKEASKPVIGFLVKQFADAIGYLKKEVISLKNKVSSFSKSLSEEKAKLSAVTEAATKEKAKLETQWSSRQSAAMKVYGTIGGLVILLFVITLLVLSRRRNKQ